MAKLGHTGSPKVGLHWHGRGRLGLGGGASFTHLDVIQQPLADGGRPLAQRAVQLQQQCVKGRLLIPIRRLRASNTTPRGSKMCWISNKPPGSE
jgi:hypothetical protein